jgi:CRISPR-associated protein Cmr5
MNQINRREMLEGGRAQYAFEKIKTFVLKANNEEKKEFKSYIKKMPGFIQTNGLGQTVAFYYSNNSKKPYKAILEILETWIKENLENVEPAYKGEQDFVEWVISLQSREYKILTMEIIALLNWMRRFVDGMVKEEDK